MEKKIYMEKLKALPSPASLVNMSLWENSCSMAIKKDKEVAVRMLKGVCKLRGHSQSTRSWSAYLPVCFHDRTDSHWDTDTCLLQQIIIFPSDFPFLAVTRGHQASKWQACLTHPETQKTHHRALVLIHLKAAGISSCLSHQLTYLYCGNLGIKLVTKILSSRNVTRNGHRGWGGGKAVREAFYNALAVSGLYPYKNKNKNNHHWV